MSTCGTVNDYNSINVCGGTNLQGEDALFVLNLPPAVNCISIRLDGSGIGFSPNLNASASVSVFRGCPGDAGSQCIGSVQNTGQAFIRLNNIKLSGGGNFYIMIDGAGACFPYRLNVQPGNCPDGGKCDFPLNVTLPFESVPGTTAGFGNDYNANNSCFDVATTGNDVVYKISLDKESCIWYQFENFTSSATVLLSNACPIITAPACLRLAPCLSPLCRTVMGEITLPAGDYYFIIKSQSNTDVQFSSTIRVLNPDNLTDCPSCNDQDNCTSCRNSGFEKMTFEGWTARFGSTFNPGLTPGFRSGNFNNGLSRHTIVTRGNFDTLIPALPVVPPDGGDYAVRLGNCNNNAQGEQLVYTFLVDSSNTNFIYRYAVVLENPNHTPDQQPFFSIDVK
ncbi:MAG TPA: hypothetical protein VFV37_02500, partial [Luteibaculaceae bacterium]|nr:hypothetical protein [Luteibaculaceae bacterium]